MSARAEVTTVPAGQAGLLLRTNDPRSDHSLIQGRTIHAIDAFQSETQKQIESFPPPPGRRPAAELIFRWKLIARTGRIPLPSCSAGHPGRSRIVAGYVLLLRAVDKAASKQEMTMNWDRVEGNWKQIKGKVQQQWGKLTNDDLNLVEGKRTELVGRIQARYGIQRDEAERQIDSWLRNLT